MRTFGGWASSLLLLFYVLHSLLFAFSEWTRNWICSVELLVAAGSFWWARNEEQGPNDVINHHHHLHRRYVLLSRRVLIPTVLHLDSFSIFVFFLSVFFLYFSYSLLCLLAFALARSLAHSIPQRQSHTHTPHCEIHCSTR